MYKCNKFLVLLLFSLWKKCMCRYFCLKKDGKIQILLKYIESYNNRQW